MDKYQAKLLHYPSLHKNFMFADNKSLNNRILTNRAKAINGADAFFWWAALAIST
jgi:hypothetical protein